jgi:hypothetical protein
MSDAPYKLQIKIGSAEFTAEGPEETVKEAYDAFMKAIMTPAVGPAVGAVTGSSNAKGISIAAADLSMTGHPPLVLIQGALDATVLERAFKREGEIISLRHLPPTPNKIADAAIVLMYGYMKITGIEDVPVTKLNEGLRRSGLNLSRLDRELGVNHALFRKGGQRSGGRYTLNNQGIKQAEDWLKDWA